LELHQQTTLKQVQTLSPQFILSQQLLQMPVTELLEELERELSENPALEMEQIPTCPHCERPMRGSVCEHCGRRNNPEEEENELFIRQQMMDYDPDQAPYEAGPSGDYEEERAPVMQFATREGSFHDFLIHNFLASNYPPGTEELGKFLVRSIDEDGFMDIDVDRIKQLFEVDEETIESVRDVIKTLEPIGVGAMDAREALDIQLRELAGHGKKNELAETLIRDFFEDIGKNKLSKISRELSVTVPEINDALDFIRRNLNPYPGREYSDRRPVQLAKPAMVIKYDGRRLTYEVIELSSFRLRVNRAYLEMYENYQKGGSVSRRDMSHIREYFRRAKFYQDSIETRRQTLDKIARALCEEQSEFLIHGLPHFNSDLTQGRLAEKIELHESTVSRAMSGKFVQVPSGDILSFEFFFDSSIRPKEYIKNIIASESSEKPISDKEITETLRKRGIDLARRTVAKYREELRIPSSYERRRA